ncbi:FAD-binding oxidoreductase [Rariglobus hedericola]
MTSVTLPFRSWGGLTTARTRREYLAWKNDPLPRHEGALLAYGMGRSYGDSCLLDDGVMIETRMLDHILEFDAIAGVVRCEAGCSMAGLLDFCVPHGWFPPVTPGTKWVTLGGCVANDVHGKNHHVAGTFGCFVNRLGLRRSDGTTLECSLTCNQDFFRATIGGLGLTGVILWVELRLKRIRTSQITQRLSRLRGIDAFFDCFQQNEKMPEYSVAWLDTSHAGEPRGLLISGDHAGDSDELIVRGAHPKLSLPVMLPDFVLGPDAIRLMNRIYYAANSGKRAVKNVHYDPFFYPLDAVGNWNRAYGKKGLVQYQFVVPKNYGKDVLVETLAKARLAGHASFLTVVKMFGSIVSPGLLSFPRPGVTVCFDFPNLGDRTARLLEDMDHTVFSAGGALYPAKDCRMSRDAFERSFPAHDAFKSLIDPACSSSFAKRTGLTA